MFVLASAHCDPPLVPDGACRGANPRSSWRPPRIAVLAVATIVALRYRMRATFVLVWIFVAETALHLVNSTIAGIHEQLFATASNPTWLILTFYVPLLWVTASLSGSSILGATSRSR
jgi:hypothetical protein